MITPLFQSQDITSAFGRQLGWRGIGLAGFSGSGLSGAVETEFLADLAAGNAGRYGYDLVNVTTNRLASAEELRAAGAARDFSKLRVIDEPGNLLDLPVNADIFDKMTGGQFPGSKTTSMVLVGVIAAAAAWFLFLRKKRR